MFWYRMTSESTRKLADYFKRNVKKGYTEDSLKWALINQGYSRMIVEDALELANTELAQSAPVLKEKPVIKYELYDADNKLVKLDKPWWKKMFKKR